MLNLWDVFALWEISYHAIAHLNWKHDSECVVCVKIIQIVLQMKILTVSKKTKVCLFINLKLYALFPTSFIMFPLFVSTWDLLQRNVWCESCLPRRKLIYKQDLYIVFFLLLNTSGLKTTLSCWIIIHWYLRRFL